MLLRGALVSSSTKTRLRASTVCVHEKKLLTVLLRDPVSGIERVFPPGGEIQAGESSEDAAVRETREETGYGVAIVPGSGRAYHYPFQWGGQWYDCTTHFFKATLDETVEQGEPERDGMHLAVLWVPLGELSERLAYDAFIRQAVLELAA